MRKLPVAGVIALCFVTGVIAVSCSNANPSPIATDAQPVAVPTPEPGLATVSGRIVNTIGREPYVNMVVRLGEVIHIEPGDEGTWVIDDATSPGDYTDEDGNFVIPNVAPKDYVLVIGDFHLRYAIVTDTPDNARVWTTSPDQVLEIGEVDTVVP